MSLGVNNVNFSGSSVQCGGCNKPKAAENTNF